MERNHDSSPTKVQTPLGIVKVTQRIKTHQQSVEAAPDANGGHLNHYGGTVIVPSKGVRDDNLPINNLEAESTSPSSVGRLIKDDATDLTQPVDPHAEYLAPKYQKTFAGKIKF